MTEEICENCGFSEEIHNILANDSYLEVCKKFKAQNHSPQENPQSVITDGVKTIRERITGDNSPQGTFKNSGGKPSGNSNGIVVSTPEGTQNHAEKSLSEKRQDTNRGTDFKRYAYAEENVKEAVKRLKAKLCVDKDYNKDCILCEFKVEIDKIMGDNLI